MKRKGVKKTVIIVLVVALVLAGGGFGGWYYLQNRNTEPVSVFPFHYLGMTEYWGDSQESYGPVTTDRIQTVFLSETQTVVDILVQPGDAVKKGDVLMVFDTTLTDLALERERLAVEKLKLQLDDARAELKEIKNMKPMVIPTVDTEEPTETNQGTAISGPYQISQNKAYDGSSREKSLILWLQDSASLNDDVFEAVREKAEEYQKANYIPSTEPETTEPETTEPEVTEPETTEPETTEPVVPPVEETTEPSSEETTEPSSEETTEPVGSEPTVPEVPSVDLTVNHFYMILKITNGNMSLGYNSVWMGMEVTGSDGEFSFRLFDPSGIDDHMTPQQTVTTPSAPQIDFGSGYTSAQIAQLRAEKEKQIKELQFQIKMAEADYAIKKTETESGEVLATIDGTVVSLLSEEEAKLSMQPILKVSGGGGFYVEGTVSELEKENLQIGQEVTINDWNTGMEHVGVVQSIGDFPSAEGYWNGLGNPNASYYPFTVFIDGSADLQEGSYVSVVYSTATTEQGIYLENPFLRTEQGKTYVYVRGADGKLEKRFVTTGKALWGSYTQVLEGLTAEDYIAFPYGKTVVEGADTVESDLSELYG